MKFAGGSLVALALAVLSPAAVALDSQEQLQFADGVFARGMWEVAIKEYQAFLPQNTNAALAEVVRYRMGECEKSLGRAKEAETHYRWVYDQSADSEYHFRAGLRLAELLDQAGRPEEKIVLLSGMAAANPPPELAAACRYMIGAAMEKSGQTAEAVRSFEAILKDYPASSFAAYAALALGGIREKQDPSGVRAVELYTRAATNPASPRVAAEAWFQLGETYFRQKKYKESARAYERLAALYPKDERVAESRFQAGWAFHNAGLYADALKIAGAALGGADTARKAEWLYLKANCERQLARNEDAAQTYAAVPQQHPDAVLADSAAYERALTLYKMGRFQDAVAQGRSLEASTRVKKDVYWLLAESYASLKDEANAVQYYRLLVDQFPDSNLAADAMYRLAHLLQRKGGLIEAAAMFGQLVEKFPKHDLAPQALFASALCYSKAQKHELAVREWGRLLQEYPKCSMAEEALYQKAVSETFLRRDAQSMETWRTLLTSFPGTKYAADARFWSGVLEEEAGKFEEAEESFRNALKVGPSPDLLGRAQFRLALVLQRRSKPDESAALLQGLLATPMREKFTPELLEWLADYHLSHHAFEPASGVADMLLSRTNEEAWTQVGWCLKGKAAQGAGKADDAQAAFEKAVALKVKTQAAAEAFLRLGDLALARNDAAKAQGFYDQAASLSSSDALLPIRVQSYAGTARALKAKGDWAGAAKHFLSVAVLFDDASLVPECLHEAAEAYAKIGKTDESRKAVRELMDRFPDSVWAKKHQP